MCFIAFRQRLCNRVGQSISRSDDACGPASVYAILIRWSERALLRDLDLVPIVNFVGFQMFTTSVFSGVMRKVTFGAILRYSECETIGEDR